MRSSFSEGEGITLHGQNPDNGRVKIYSGGVTIFYRGKGFIKKRGVSGGREVGLLLIRRESPPIEGGI